MKQLKTVCAVFYVFNSGEYNLHTVNLVDCNSRAYAFSREGRRKTEKKIVRKTQKGRNAEWYDRVNEWLRENRLKYEKKKGKNNRKRHAFTRLADTNRKKKQKRNHALRKRLNSRDKKIQRGRREEALDNCCNEEKDKTKRKHLHKRETYMKRVHMRIDGTRPHKNVQQIHASNRQEDKEIYTLYYIYTCIRVKYN